MLTIAIVEDEDREAELLSGYINHFCGARNTDYNIKRFTNGADFIRSYRPAYDIVFMDIMLPGQNGVETARELRELDEIIGKLAERLNKGGRICVITFHSLEDRIVKREFQYLEAKCICPPKQPVCTCNKVQTVKIITKKPLTASEEELAVNPRAQSAKLRVAERV